MPPILELSHLTKTYRSHVKQEGVMKSLRSLFVREYTERTAVRDISFSMEEGELIGMLGANGAGKTTTLKMLAGLLYPTSGTAQILGFTPWERSNAFKQQFAIVLGQRNQLWWDIPAADSFALLKEIYAIPDTVYRKRVHDLAERLDVADKLHIQVRRLSLGERMKCELIGSLLHAPRVMLLDEPTIGLDVVAQKSVREFIREHNQSSATTIILTSHYMHDITALCKRVLVIDDGKLMFDGTLDTLIAEYAEEKLLTVSFATNILQEDIQHLGTIVEYSPQRIVVRIPRKMIAHTTAQVLEQFSVDDLVVEEVPIEDVIRSIFTERIPENTSQNLAI